MVTENKWMRRIFLVYSALCAIALVVCLISDWAVNRWLGWSLFVLGAVPFVWVMALPSLLLVRHRVMFTLVAFTILLMPYLFFTAQLTGGGWFLPLGLPIGIAGIVAFWASFFLLKFVRLNRWYLSAALVFIYGVAINGVTNACVNLYLSIRIYGVSDIISLLACLAVCVLLCVIGQKDARASAAQKQDA